MHRRLPLTLALITRDAPEVQSVLEAWRPYVNEIVVVDTGTQDEELIRAEKSFADTFEVFTTCNDDEGRIDDFAVARNRAYELASYHAVIWADSDDEVTGLENLRHELEYAKRKEEEFVQPILLQYRYEGEDGQGIFRERLVTQKSAVAWKGRVHETLVEREPLHVEKRSALLWKHKQVPHAHRTGRNVRLLEKMLREEGSTPSERTLYNLAREYRQPSRRQQQEAQALFERALLLNPPPGRRYNILLHLTELAWERMDWADAEKHATAALSLEFQMPSDAECIGKAQLALAATCHGWWLDTKNLERAHDCIHFLVSSCIAAKRFLDRVHHHEVLRHLHPCWEAVGDIEGALRMCNAALEMHPHDLRLREAREKYVRKMNTLSA